MLIFSRKIELVEYITQQKEAGKTIGFVPTMGALHEGHISLIQKAKNQCDIVVCSIFVNPTQFNESHDFDVYPRTESVDQAFLENNNCDALYLPSTEDVYENETSFTIDVSAISKVMEGEKRPGHFDGVMRVVKQLFEIVKPTHSFFGLKDYQQFLIIKKLSETLNIGGEVVGCETVREENGLALSSRNQLLSSEQKNIANQINQSSEIIKKSLENYFAALQNEKEKLARNFDIEYFELRDGNDLSLITENDSNAHIRLFFAGKIGNVRLIDNLKIK